MLVLSVEVIYVNKADIFQHSRFRLVRVMMTRQKNTQANDFNDAIELMFFAYRDFIADPDALLAAHDFGRAHHRVLHFVAQIRAFLSLIYWTFCALPSKAWRGFCAS